jgi:hypothetical protein
MQPKCNILPFPNVILDAVSLLPELKSFTMKKLFVRSCLLALFLVAGTVKGSGQTDLPPVFRQGTIPEQMKYLDEHTRIYENYRAIREDLYRMVSRNMLDSLNQAKRSISTLVEQNARLDQRMDSLQTSLEASDRDMEKAIRTKNSIRVLGIEVGKVTYNSVMWTLLAVMAFLLVTGYLAFRQNRSATTGTRKDLEELQAAFEEYRTKTRLEREKTAIDHFKEIQKLKGK